MRMILIVIIFLLSGCSLLGPVKPPVEQEYQLNPEAISVIQRSMHRITLLVTLPNALGVENSKDMIYSIKPYQMDSFAKNRWTKPPSEMLQPFIVEALQKTHYFLAIGTPPSLGLYDFVLNTDIMQFQQVFFGNCSVFRLKIRAQLIEFISGKVIRSKEFSAEQIAPFNSPYGGVIAANRALARVLSQLANWTTVQPLKHGKQNKSEQRLDVK